ncbi:TIGR03086 family metal-binding protein [Streptomyces carpaticus]|uniref:TIGR03086 family metal-binding protein n=1 Tax=Streptomyces carpaticus TaxID=285558 RepID=UPI00220749C4|nr:TIGR03086 family metal-binding protein [Streptomyces carpaticus]
MRERHFDAPTPCAAYTVRDLLRHLLGLTVAFRDAARKDFGPATRTDPADPDAPRPEPAGDWRGRLRTQLDELVAAWREPAAWRGETEAGGITLPAPVAGAVALNEVFLHGWDLARATGQPYRADEATARACSPCWRSRRTRRSGRPPASVRPSPYRRTPRCWSGRWRTAGGCRPGARAAGDPGARAGVRTRRPGANRAPGGTGAATVSR